MWQTAISSTPCSPRAKGWAGAGIPAGARIPLAGGIVPRFNPLACAYMQGLILRVSHCVLVSALHRRKTCFEITRICGVGNALSVGAHVPSGAVLLPARVAWGRGHNSAGRRKVCKSLMIGKKKKSIFFKKPEALPGAGCRLPHCFPLVCLLPALEMHSGPPS